MGYRAQLSTCLKFPKIISIYTYIGETLYWRTSEILIPNCTLLLQAPWLQV